MRLFAVVFVAVALCLASSPAVDNAKVVGYPGAPIRIEIFSSFDCPHCKVMHEQTVPQFLRDYVTPGKLVLVNREFPLSGPAHPHAREAANYATAAARIGKYEQVADALFADQAIWVNNGKVWDSVAKVLTPAEQKKVQALAKDPGVLAEVQRDVDLGNAARVNATPTLILTQGAKRYALPTANYELYRSLLDSLLK